MRGAVTRLEVSRLNRTDRGETVLQDISFRVCEGESTVILGDSYSCKNALLRVLAGRYAGCGEEVVFYNRQGSRYRPVRTYCPAGEAVSTNLTVREHLLLGCDMAGLKRTTAALCADRMIDRFGLTNEKDLAVKRLDREERRLISVLTALAPMPDMAFLEEPTDGLSDSAIMKLWEHLVFIREKTLIVITSRYVQDAEKLGGQILFAAGPGIVMCGTAQEILDSTGARDLTEAYMAGLGRSKGTTR